MTKRGLAYLLGIGFCCAACGGGGGSSPQNGNPYAGTYFGEYVDQDGNAGQIQITVKSSGSVSGTYSNPTATFNLVTGSVDGSGKGVVSIPHGIAQIQMSPYLQPALTMTIRPTNSANPNSVAVFVSDGFIILPSGNPYTGSYAGTIRDTTANNNQALALNIGSDGAISGYAVVLENGAPISTSVSGKLTSTGSLSCVVQATQISVSGNVTKGVDVYGPVQLSNGDAATLTITSSTNPNPPPRKLVLVR